MPAKANRWGGKQNFDPNTGKFASKTGAPTKRSLTLKRPHAKLKYKRPK